MFESVVGVEGIDWDAFDASVSLGFDEGERVTGPGEWVAGVVEPFGLAPVSPDEVREYPDSAARWVARSVPDPSTGSVLAGVDLERLSGVGRIDLLVGLHKQIAALQAIEYRLLAVMKRRAEQVESPGENGGRLWVAEEVRAAVRVGRDEAQGKLVWGQVLVEQLPRTLELLTQGAITGRQAQRLAEETCGLSSEQISRLEERVLARAPMQSFTQFRRSVTTAVAAVAPKSQEQSRANDMDARRIVVSPQPNGMSTLWMLAPTEGLATLMAAVEALATRTDPTSAGELPDECTAEQRRVDALLEIGEWVLNRPDLPRRRGKRPHIVITLTMETLLGLSDQPADLKGVGPLPAEVARRIAFDPTGTWRRMIVDPTNGRCLDYGHTQYRPPPDLDDAVTAENPTCVFPTCTRPAAACHLDHTHPYSQGGPTAAHNLGPLCLRHHRLKHLTHWRLHKLQHGYEWTSPTGHVYRTQPDPYPVTTDDEQLITPAERAAHRAAENHARAEADERWKHQAAELRNRINTARAALRTQAHDDDRPPPPTHDRATPPAPTPLPDDPPF